MTSIAWLVALHCPRAVSPHPNFASTDFVSPAGMLGLVIQGRGHEVDDFLARSNRLLGGSERRLIDAAKGLFDNELRASAVHELSSLVHDDSVAPGFAATAALLGTLGLTEADAFADAFELLSDALSRLTDSPDDRFFEGSLKQQAAMRLAESGQDDSTARANARDALESIDIKSMPRFRTSKGAKWGPQTTLRNVRELLLEANQDLEDRLLGFPDEKILRSLLRRETSAIASSILRDGQSGASAFVAENFDRFALSNERTFRSTDPVDGPVWRALTQLELAGYYRQVLRHRCVLGQLRLMRAVGNAHDAPDDGLRLIRQSGDLKVLNLALNHVRGAGPLRVLKRETEDILTRRLEPRLLRDVELAVLTSGAQTLGERQARDALEVVLSAVSEPSVAPANRFQLPAIHTEHLIKAAVALAPVAQASGIISDWLLEQVQSIGSTQDELTVRALTRGLSAVSWNELGVERKLSWREWLISSEGAEGWSVFRDELEPMVRSVSGDEALQPERLTPGRIATELNSVMAGGQAPGWFVSRAIPEVRAMLERPRTDARNGRFGMGAVDAADIAAGLCLYLGADLWEPLVAYLTDALLPRSFKASATDRLANGSEQIPRSAVAELTARADGLLAGSSLPFFFDGPDIEPFPAAIRLLGAINAYSSAQLVVSVARLASGDERSRLEAGRTVTSLVQSSATVPEWLVFAAMQLSADTKANVRAESGRSLALAIGRVDFAVELMTERLRELLDEDGILVPLLVLRGLAGDVTDMPTTVLEQVGRIAETHIIHGVREQAQYLLNA